MCNVRFLNTFLFYFYCFAIRREGAGKSALFYASLLCSLTMYFVTGIILCLFDSMIYPFDFFGIVERFGNVYFALYFFVQTSLVMLVMNRCEKEFSDRALLLGDKRVKSKARIADVLWNGSLVFLVLAILFLARE